MTHSVTVAGKTFSAFDNADGLFWQELTGWYEGAQNRLSISEIPGQHGGFAPTQTLLGPRNIEFVGVVQAADIDAAEALMRNWYSTLSAKNGFVFSVTDSQGTLSSQVWVDGALLGKRLDRRTWQFSMKLVAPDPIRYGEARTYSKSGVHLVSDGLQYPVQYPLDYGSLSAQNLTGYLQLTNDGTAPVYPSWKVKGPISAGFEIQSDGFTIRFTRSLTVDESVEFGPFAGGRAIMQDGSDASIYLTRSQWATVAAESQRGYLFVPIDSAAAGSYVEATIRDGWY